MEKFTHPFTDGAVKVAQVYVCKSQVRNPQGEKQGKDKGRESKLRVLGKLIGDTIGVSHSNYEASLIGLWTAYRGAVPQAQIIGIPSSSTSKNVAGGPFTGSGSTAYRDDWAAAAATYCTDPKFTYAAFSFAVANMIYVSGSGYTIGDVHPSLMGNWLLAPTIIAQVNRALERSNATGTMATKPSFRLGFH